VINTNPGLKYPVCIIEDDASVRSALRRLLLAYGISSEAYANTESFLKTVPACQCACIIADVRMPGMGGLKLQQHLLDRGIRTPFIFVTASEDEETRAEAKRMGSVAYFRKPIDDQALIDAIRWALSKEKDPE
jgi:FixJ family two-component response regulator